MRGFFRYCLHAVAGTVLFLLLGIVLVSLSVPGAALPAVDPLLSPVQAAAAGVHGEEELLMNTIPRCLECHFAMLFASRELQALVTDTQWQQYQALLAAEPDNEVIDFATTSQELGEAGPLPDVPLVILSHGQSPDPTGFPAGWPVAQQEQLWQGLQQKLAGLTPDGTQEMVPDSGDMVQLAKPELVVAAIREMVDQLRR